MRITNKIMQNNSLAHVNNLKLLEDKLNTQFSTGKEITKPSDDPVIAVRALRLRLNVNETTQFYKKNIPDASSWLETTEKVIDKVADLISGMYECATDGTKSYERASDLSAIVSQMRQYSDEIFHNGDADYAGRTLFTGYRTGSRLCFSEQTKQKYKITQDVYGDSCFDSVTKVEYTKADGIETGKNNGVKEQDITYSKVGRIRLAYKGNDLKDEQGNSVPMNIRYATGIEQASGKTIFTDLSNGRCYYEDGSMVMEKDANGNDVQMENPTCEKFGQIKTLSLYTTQAAGGIGNYTNVYQYVENTNDAMVYVPETGEVLLGKDVLDYLKKTTEQNRDDTEWDERKICIDYQKSEWTKGETRPEHYFLCESNGVTYNKDLPANQQIMNYDVGLNQSIRVNTTAGEVFHQGIGREVDELEDALREFTKLEGYRDELKSLLVEDKSYQNQYDAVDKAFNLQKEKINRMFSGCITRYQKYLDQVNLAETNEGSRSARLQLIETRLSTQLDTFKDLQSKNEDADETEVAINLSSASLTYKAALMATSKVVSTSLLDYL